MNDLVGIIVAAITIGVTVALILVGVNGVSVAYDRWQLRYRIAKSMLPQRLRPSPLLKDLLR